MNDNLYNADAYVDDIKYVEHDLCNAFILCRLLDSIIAPMLFDYLFELVQ